MGTIVIMVRLYSLPGLQTIDLLVMYSAQSLNFRIWAD
jgi:hypothetical protein